MSEKCVKVLPIEPTKEMAFAGINAVVKGQKYDDPRDPQFAADMKLCDGDKGAVRAMQSYRAMVAAAPPAAEADLTVTPEAIAAAWAAWHSRHGGKIGPGPAFVEAIEAAVKVLKGR